MSSVESSLSSLLPTLNSQLPPELIHLATSLLAQSRTRISLKPTEEIARPYACAEIACKRLQFKLKLPSIYNGGSPLPPKVYAKLLALMEKELKIGVRNSTGEPSPGKVAVTPKKNRNPATVTPTTTPSKKTPTAFAGKISTTRPTSSDEAPEWIMPLIRRLCSTFSTPLLPPHVYTGSCIVLKLAGLSPQQNGEDDWRRDVAAMTIAIYFMVLTRMQRGKMTVEGYAEKVGKACGIAGEGKAKVGRETVDEWIKRMNDEGWCRGQEWWGSVPEDVMDVDSTAEGVEMGDEEEFVISRRKRKRLIEEDEGDEEGVLLPGLGTMMQDAVDYLSEERKLDYLKWKQGIMVRIKGMEKGDGRAIAAR